MFTMHRSSSLAVRQAKTVFLVSVALGLVFSVYMILLDLNQEQQRIQKHYQLQLMQHYVSASQATYHLNPLLANQVVVALMSDPAVNSVKIVDDYGDTLAARQRDNQQHGIMINALSNYLTPDSTLFTTALHQPDSDLVLGRLSFTIDGSSLAKTFVSKAHELLLFDLLRTIVLTCILLVFFYYKLSKPLMVLVNWVQSLQNSKQTTPIPLSHRKDELSHLASTFQHIWQEREIAEAKLNQLAYYDSLTGLANRSLLLQKLDETLDQTELTQSTGALFYLDLDRFKTINDSLGHTIGDMLLKAIAERLAAWIKPGCLTARIGGDEFAILLPCVAKSRAEEIAKQVLTLISNPFTINEHQLYCTVSIGIATFPAEIGDNIDILRQADTALYRTKATQRNHFMFYEPTMHAQVEAFQQIERGLHEALSLQQLELHYQPQVNLDHQIIGVEALIRWNHPQKGLLYPGHFMAVAEETGQILKIGNWIIEHAIHQYANWKRLAVLPRHFERLAINISPVQFAQENFVAHIRQCLNDAGVTGEHIELEITENLLLENIESAIQKMAELKALQVKISIDDFGTGYSSLRYLKHLSVDVLKIDRSFVTHLVDNENDQAIVDSIIMIASRLNLAVIAEGVENLAQFDALKALGCQQFQGFVFDKPLCCEAATQRLTKGGYILERRKA